MAAGMEGQYVRSLFVTLRRGWIGKPHFHQRVLAALGLHTRHQCVERPNNESIRGMLAKVRTCAQPALADRLDSTFSLDAHGRCVTIVCVLPFVLNVHLIEVTKFSSLLQRDGQAANVGACRHSNCYFSMSVVQKVNAAGNISAGFTVCDILGKHKRSE
eukprot:1152165-Pelagomonas_calceolata.AAC.1